MSTRRVDSAPAQAADETILFRQPAGCRVCVTNLHASASASEIRRVFDKGGLVHDVIMFMKPAAGIAARAGKECADYALVPSRDCCSLVAD